MKNLRKTRRMECDCTKPPKGFEKYTTKRGLYLATHPIHDLCNTTYYPNVQYRCILCGDIKRVKIEK